MDRWCSSDALVSRFEPRFVYEYGFFTTKPTAPQSGAHPWITELSEGAGMGRSERRMGSNAGPFILSQRSLMSLNNRKAQVCVTYIVVSTALRVKGLRHEGYILLFFSLQF